MDEFKGAELTQLSMISGTEPPVLSVATVFFFFCS